MAEVRTGAGSPRIRDAVVGEAAALEALQRRSSDVWEEYREALADSGRDEGRRLRLRFAAELRCFQELCFGGLKNLNQALLVQQRREWDLQLRKLRRVEAESTDGCRPA